jgi:uncharacterized membrane protein SpoIIM required for sporulation
VKVSQLLEARRKNWQELEALCDQVGTRTRKGMGPELLSRYSSLYRSACADLALADAYQLPPNTVQFLHRLVGRAHNQLYRTHKFQWSRWAEILLYDVPQTIFNDRCVQFAFLLFWGLFITSAAVAYSESYWPEYAEAICSREALDGIESRYKQGLGTQLDFQIGGSGKYIQHNTGIGLQCFAYGLLVIPGIVVTAFNASWLGAIFGYMARPDVDQDAANNFFEFVTAHGPFELTAIVLSAGAGLRLGWAWIYTDGLTRIASLQKTAREAMPIMGAAMTLFFGAAMIEGFLSPTNGGISIAGNTLISGLVLKRTVAVVCSLLMMFYFVLLGVPRRMIHAA